MAVKRYDGSAWQTVAGLGAQGPAATSSSIATWVKTASGGETSLSGNDDNSQALAYTVGQELVFINGTLLKRGSDYTATNGTSITGLTALAANDVATVWTVNAFSVTNAISSGLVTTTGDIIYASSANVPARLGIGSTGQVLKVSGGLPAWGTDSGSLVKIASGTFSNQTSVTIDDCFSSTYRNYIAYLQVYAGTFSDDMQLQFRYAGPTTQTSTYSQSGFGYSAQNTLFTWGGTSLSQVTLSNEAGNSGNPSFWQLSFGYVGNASEKPAVTGYGLSGHNQQASLFAGINETARTYTGFLLKSSSSNITGSYQVYGVQN